ncbi:MAG: phage holin family protein [Solirubrobacteraceae bacterium]
MTDQQTRPISENTQNISKALQDVSERAQILVREEVELAKLEVSQKVASLGRGAAIGAAGGVFAIFGLAILLQGLAWLAWYVIPFPQQQFFWGFFVVAGLLFMLGGLAAYVAYRAVRAGSPPAPKMAMDEAKLIRETVKSPHPDSTVGPR